MKGKRRRAHSSGRVVVDADEIDDFGFDVRLFRRWKRRIIANQEFKRNSGGKNSRSDGKPNETPEKIPETKNMEINILDDDDDLVDADYRKYLDSLALQAVDDGQVSNNRSLDNGYVGGDALNCDFLSNAFDYGHPQSEKFLENNNTEIDDSKGGEFLEDDYETLLPSAASNPFVHTGFNSNAINKSGDNVDIGNDVLVENRAVIVDSYNNDAFSYNNDAFNEGDPQHEAILVGNNTEVDDNKEDGAYRIYLHSLHSEPFVDGDVRNDDYETLLPSLASERFVDTGVNSNAINKSGDNGDIGNDVLVENRTVNVDAYNDDAFNEEDPQHEATLESISTEVDDKEDGAYGIYLHSLHSEPFVDGDVCNDNFVDDGFNANVVHSSVESGTSGDELVENKHVDYDAATCNNYNNNDNGDDDSNNNNNNNNNMATSDMDPQSKKIPERNNIIIDGDYKRYLNGCDLGLSGGDGDVSNGCSVDAATAFDINSVYQSTENRTCGNLSIKNDTTDAESVETRSLNNDSDHNDDLDDVDPQFKFFLENLREDGKSYVLEVPMSDGVSEILKYEQDSEPDDGCRIENPDMMRPSQATQGTTSARHDCEHEMEQDIDENYKFFLHSVKQEGKYLVFRPESGGEVVYDGDEESLSDSEVIVINSDPFEDGNYTPFVTSKSKRCDVLEEDGNGNLKNLSSNDSSWFRERVVEILRKPYDEKEYHELLEEVRRHRLVKEERDMRNGRVRIYSARRLGPSYLELHKDLARNIQNAGSSKPKILNLLRGFFYWLQNLAHDGVFKPWTDLSCLEVLPNRKSE